MQTRWYAVALIAAVSIGFFAGVGFSEDPQPSEDEMMKKMMELGKAGPAHKLFRSMVGEWDTVMKIWSKPGEPELSKGTASNELILDGRYLRQDFKGKYNGMPHHGTGFLGHDNFLKNYESVWLDNFGSSMLFSKGKANKDGKSFALSYTWEGPMGTMPGRMLYTITGKDGHTLEGWMTQGGQEVKHMEITFTRTKKAAVDCPK